jgi:hypothetical protein
MVEWNWRSGQFQTALMTAPGRAEWFYAFDILVAFPPAPLSPKVSPTTESPDKGGRPPVWDWEEAALKMAGLHYRGDLQPRTIADVVRALQDWAGETGKELTDSTARPHAKRILEAIRCWELD